MFVQRLYGLLVRCELPIPFAPAATSTSNIDITVIPGLPPAELASREYVPWPPSESAPHHRVARSGDVWRLLYDDGTSIHVTTDTVYLSWPEDQTFEDACTYLVGAPFAVLLRSRGFACLHGSCVEQDGRTMAFVGPSGAGKSTLAAAAVEHGGMLVADDLLAVRIENGHPVVMPSYAGVRLWPEAVELLRDDRDALPRLSPNWDKRVLEATLVSGPVRLNAVCVLSEGSAAGPSVVNPLVQLIANAYRPDLATPEWQRDEFLTLAATIETVPCSSAPRRTGWRELTRIAEHRHA